MENIILKCFSCGKERSCEVNSLPKFAFNIISIAKNNEMLGVIDFNHRRSLVFCNEECRKKAITKKGTYRVKKGY